MTEPALPDWAAWLIAMLALSGAAFTLTGAIGLVRLRTFYERVHAPTLGATLGTGLILTASILLLSLTEGRIVLRDALIGVFLAVTTPLSLLLLARAAAYRDRHEENADAPPEP